MHVRDGSFMASLDRRNRDGFDHRDRLLVWHESRGGLAHVAVALHNYFCDVPKNHLPEYVTSAMQLKSPACLSIDAASSNDVGVGRIESK